MESLVTKLHKVDNMGYEDLSGKVFGKLTVLKKLEAKRFGNGKTYSQWECLCDCGNISILTRRALTSSGTKSCGCFHKEMVTTHGLSLLPEYDAWYNMKSRCYNPRDYSYESYGGRGIKVCDRWLELENIGLYNFLEDMGSRGENESLDRIDVNGNYCPENCRWTTKRIQAFNTRINTNNTSGRTGVVWRNSKHVWEVYIMIDKKKTYVGRSKDFEIACKMRSEAELKNYGFIKE